MQECLTDVTNDATVRQSTPPARAALAPQELQFMQKIRQDLSPPPLHDASAIHAPRNADLGDTHWRDRVRSLPTIRPALIAMDEAERGVAWSSAFSLAKADIEPWTSFFSGYKTSRLFAEPARPARDDGTAPALQLQFEVQAILELRGLDRKFVLEPPVQISQPAEYLDLIAEIEACRNPTHAQQLAKIANEAHDRMLAQAVQNGRDMGDRLYHALLGPDCTNLSIEWQRLYQRKPSVDELCYMLTTGRIKIMPAKPRATAAAAPQVEKPQPREAQAAPQPQLQPQPRSAPAAARPAPAAAAVPQPRNVAQTKPAMPSAVPSAAPTVARKIADETGERNRYRRFVRKLRQLTVGCAAYVMHAFAG